MARNRPPRPPPVPPDASARAGLDAPPDPPPSDPLSDLLDELASTAPGVLSLFRVTRVAPSTWDGRVVNTGMISGYILPGELSAAEIMDRLGADLGSGTYQVIACDSHNKFIRGGSEQVRVSAGPPRNWIKPGAAPPPPDPGAPAAPATNGAAAPPQSLADRLSDAVLQRMLGGESGGSTGAGAVAVVREQLAEARQQNATLTTRLDAAQTAQRRGELAEAAALAKVATLEERVAGISRERDDLRRQVETRERELTEARRELAKAEREATAAPRTTPLSELAQAVKIFRPDGDGNAALELYKSAVSGIVKDLPAIMADMLGNRDDGRMTPKDWVDVVGKAGETLLAARAGAMAPRPAPAAGAIAGPAAPRPAPPAPAPPEAPRTRGVSAATAQALPEPASAAQPAAHGRTAASAQPLPEPTPAAVAAPATTPGHTAPPAPSEPSGPESVIAPELWTQILAQIASGLSGDGFAHMLAGWITDEDPRGQLVSEMVWRAAGTAEYAQVREYVLRVATGERKAALESAAGDRWLRGFCTTMHAFAQQEAAEAAAEAAEAAAVAHQPAHPAASIPLDPGQNNPEAPHG